MALDFQKIAGDALQLQVLTPFLSLEENHIKHHWGSQNSIHVRVFWSKFQTNPCSEMLFSQVLNLEFTDEGPKPYKASLAP